MKLKTKLMMFTAAAALSANMAYAAINPKTLAAAYIAEGYTYVEVKVGPTQTKLEGVRGDRKVEVIYNNATGEIIKQEFESAGDDYIGRTGVEIEDTDSDFEENDDEDDDENDDDASDDDENDDDENDDDSSDDDENDDDSNDDDESSDDENDSSDDSDEEDDSSSDDEDDSESDDNNDEDSGEDDGDEDED